MEDVFIALVIGLVGGLAAGLLGIGGGAVFVPGLVILIGTEQIVAQGVSLTVIIVTAAVAAFRHRHNRTINYHVASWTVVPAVALAVAGALVANEIDGDILRRIFGGMLLVVSARMVYQTARTWRATNEAATPLGSAGDSPR